MAELGSFVLLLALALSAYSFLAGLVALIRKQPGSERLSETARRAGIASFGAVFIGAVILVTAAFRNDFSISYILHHSNRDLPFRISLRPCGRVRKARCFSGRCCF